MKPSLANAARDAATIRLGRLAPLVDDDRAMLETAASEARRIQARRELMAMGDPVRWPTLLLSGWACRYRDLPNGGRQILDLVLPGELIGFGRQSEPKALSAVMALTEVSVCPLPDAQPGSGLAQAYEESASLSEAALLRQITRLGRLNALQRLADFLLELHERLLASDSAELGSFPFPLTQEALADVLGLTSVHVNRTLQVMRREGVLVLQGGVARLPNFPKLRALVTAIPDALSREW